MTFRLSVDECNISLSLSLLFGFTSVALEYLDLLQCIGIFRFIWLIEMEES